MRKRTHLLSAQKEYNELRDTIFGAIVLAGTMVIFILYSLV
jgi:hypothetical protein